MGTPLEDFLISIIGLEIGLMLFFFYRKPKFKKFAEYMTILLLIMAPIMSIIPLLVQYKGYIYLFLPIYLVAINAWLFFTKYVVFGKTDWQIETDVKKMVRKVYLTLAFGFIAVLTLLTMLVPQNLKS